MSANDGTHHSLGLTKGSNYKLVDNFMSIEYLATLANYVSMRQTGHFLSNY